MRFYSILGHEGLKNMSNKDMKSTIVGVSSVQAECVDLDEDQTTFEEELMQESMKIQGVCFSPPWHSEIRTSFVLTLSLA